MLKEQLTHNTLPLRYQEAHYYSTFRFDEEGCIDLEICGAAFWYGLERLYITDIMHAGLPVVLAISTTGQFGDGKRIRIIHNQRPEDVNRY
ncbi:MAG: hypothetical protein AAFP77_22280 [Bacteroidota bacterium]